MPSALIGNMSGGSPLFSGWPMSGQIEPYASLMLKWDPNASGLAYVTLSGGTTISSGGYYLSGTSGLMDGFPMRPNDVYNIPRLAFTSGQCNVHVSCDQAASGQSRMYWEFY